MALALLPVDGAHAASWEEMATEMSSAEAAAYKGLQQCIETVMAEVERLSSAEQKATDYRSPDDGLVPDHRPRNACRRMASVFMAAPESLSTLFEGTPSISTDAQRKVVFLLMGMFCLAGVWVYSTQRGLQERKTCIQSQLLLDKL